MNREIHVRFWGGLEVKFLRSTRLKMAGSKRKRLFLEKRSQMVISSDVSGISANL